MYLKMSLEFSTETVWLIAVDAVLTIIESVMDRGFFKDFVGVIKPGVIVASEVHGTFTDPVGVLVVEVIKAGTVGLVFIGHYWGCPGRSVSRG